MQRFDEVFSASYARVIGDGAYNPAFISRFYEIFLQSSPEIETRFANTDMSRQKTMLHDSLDTLVDFNRSRRLSANMQHLAQIHSSHDRDIPPDMYALWLDSLMQTVAEFDPAFDRQTELAWRLMLAPGICYLQFSYVDPLNG
jgi:hemoglobin-like flavoprotein